MVASVKLMSLMSLRMVRSPSSPPLFCVAVGDDAVRVATPHTTIVGCNEVTRDARTIADLATAEGAGEFVVGLPLTADGQESEQTVHIRKFASELARLSGKPVHLQDEHLTSYAAEEVLREAALTRKKKKALTDRIAAQKILQAWLDRGT